MSDQRDYGDECDCDGCSGDTYKLTPVDLVELNNAIADIEAGRRPLPFPAVQPEERGMKG